MTGSREKISKELQDLTKRGFSLLISHAKKVESDKSEGIPKMETKEYQIWYTMALAAVRQLAPDRLDEFEKLYRNDKRKEGKLIIPSMKLILHRHYLQSHTCTLF